MQHNYFMLMIEHLRKDESVILYNNVLEMNERDTIEVLRFLRLEYQAEVLNYPHQAPAFHPEAALWAAKTIYVSAQLLLFREHKEKDLVLLLPDYMAEVGPAEILSADICLRFLPELLLQIKLIDGEDGLISLLENILMVWHYSAINYKLDETKMNFDAILANSCLQQLYLNRIVDYKNLQLASLPFFKPLIDQNMGLFAPVFWKEYEIEKKSNE